MVMEIPVTRGRVALVDDVDYERVIALGKWHTEEQRHTFYARRRILVDGKRPSVWMHAFIMGGYGFDHINLNGLDNRRSNLRAATHSQNLMNQAPRASTKSGYKGVHWNRGWLAQISADGRKRHLGIFPTALDAALAYDEAAREIHGEFACINFPQERSA